MGLALNTVSEVASFIVGIPYEYQFNSQLFHLRARALKMLLGNEGKIVQVCAYLETTLETQIKLLLLTLAIVVTLGMISGLKISLSLPHCFSLSPSVTLSNT